MRILFLGDANAGFLTSLATQLHQRWPALRFEVLDWSRPDGPSAIRVSDSPPMASSPGGRPLARLARRVGILLRFARALRSLPYYDVIHIHFVYGFYAFFAPLLHRRCRAMVATFWGSDARKAGMIERLLQRSLLRRCSVITCSGEDTLSFCAAVYGASIANRLRLVRFGLPLLDLIDDVEDDRAAEVRARLGIPDGAIVVTCGTNANPVHQHQAVLHALVGGIRARERFCFVFPLGYGGRPEYRAEVAAAIAASGLRAIVIDRYLSSRDVASLRRLSQLFVHVPVHDQFSGAMQEQLYAGGAVVTGTWLPYRELEVRGAHLYKIEHLADVPKAIEAIASGARPSAEEVARNRSAVRALSSWEMNAAGWRAMYSFRAEDDAIPGPGDPAGAAEQRPQPEREGSLP